MKRQRFIIFVLAATAVLALAAPTWAADVTAGDVQIMADTLWVLIAGFLVFFMNTGFGCVEAGFCRAKNAVNILGKNFVVFAIASIAFYFVGWTLMFGDGNAFLGTQGWLVAGPDNSPKIEGLSYLVKADINEKFKLDLDDEKTAEKYANLVAKIDDLSETARTTITSSTVGEGDDAKPAMFAVKLDVPDHGAFENEYPASDFYWGVYPSIAWAGVPLLAKFFFQLVFAGTAATIVSGCVAERIHYKSFMVFTVFVVALTYPITGHWIWGGGWLANLGDYFEGLPAFSDFAGSTVVHSVGGWAGLAGILLLGPRLGKFRPKGGVQPIPGHSMALAFLGGMVLWLGWFGFNPGSTMGLGDLGLLSNIVVTTNMACAAGTMVATVLAWIVLGKPDFSMTINGALAGLVAITAPCAAVSPISSLIIGAIAGVLVVFAVITFDRMRIDDPVGALSVHLANGIWGTLAVGLFAIDGGLLWGGTPALLITQIIGIVAVGVFTFGGSLIVWTIIKYTLGLRVDAEHEIVGLDVSEMGMEAYNGFQVSDPHEHILQTEPRAAAMPPNGVSRFSVVVEGASNSDLIKSWSEMCKPSDGDTPEAFKSVYPFMTTVQGNRFNFRGGDREKISKDLEMLLKDRLKSNVKVHVQS